MSCSDKVNFFGVKVNFSPLRKSRKRFLALLGVVGWSLFGVAFGVEVGRRESLSNGQDEISFGQLADLRGKPIPSAEDKSENYQDKQGVHSIEPSLDSVDSHIGEQSGKDEWIGHTSAKGVESGNAGGDSDKPTHSQASATEVDVSESDDELYKELEVFTSVIAIVQRDYVQRVAGKKLVEGAIRGMLSSLDPHSGYLDADFFQDLQSQTKGEFGGLGVEITVKDGSLVVVAPMEGSPAERAGLKAGDQIVRIGVESTKQFSIIDAVKRLRGPRGSEVRLSVLRQGMADPLELVIVRDNIALKSVRGRYFGDGYGYVRVNQFAEKTTDDLKKALQSFRDQSGGQQIRGLVLDLRNNPGGLLSQAVAVGDLFLEDGIIVYTDGRVEGQKQKFYAHPRGTEPKYPMIVMVNGGSASASEIVAGSLKEAGRALVLGSQTFGKGSVQTITPLENGGAVTLTTALYYTRSGRSLQALGVSPDIAIDAAGAVITTPEDSKGEAPSKGGNGEIQEGSKPEVTGAESVDGALNQRLQPVIDDANQEDPVREGDLPGAIKNPDVNLLESSPQGQRAKEAALSGSNEGKKLPLLGKNGGSRELSINYEKDEISTILSRDPQLDKAYGILRSYGEFN